MTKLTPSMRLKVKRDTFFFPDSHNSVYFRNNVSSFHMEGSMMEQWIEKLIPMFNGEYTLGELTEGLTEPYQKRVYDIAEVLYQNEFVRDVSQEHPHQLEDKVLKKYASQIEFLDHLGGSGAYRFQCYRQTKVLAIGAGPFFIALVSALIESGLPAFHVLITDSVPTNRKRLKELADHSQVEVKELTVQKGVSWQEIISPFQWVLYVSQEGNIKELQELQQSCKKKTGLLPAICFEQIGMAGPLVSPNSEGCWESAWRIVHQPVFSKGPKLAEFSSTAGAMLANVIVFELVKKVSGVAEQENQFFLLNLSTLEGNWHSFLPHPLVARSITMKQVQTMEAHLEQSPRDDELLHYFSQLTSEEAGIFHAWEEGDLKQLPLAQCGVQVVDPLSKGPAQLLEEIVCAALTHEEARKEAGLAGCEVYISRLLEALPYQFDGIGVGATFSEGLHRGLQKSLTKKLAQQKNIVSPMQLGEVKDEACQYYLQALTTLGEVPVISLGERILGFPVIWVGVGDSYYNYVDLNITLALRGALKQALMKKEAKKDSVIWREAEREVLEIPFSGERGQFEILQKSIGEIVVFELIWEALSELKVVGVVLREEEAQ